MPVTRRPIPQLPDRPRVQSVAKDLRRSYPTGRQEFSRAFSGQVLELKITTADRFPPGAQAHLATTMNAGAASDPIEIPFERADDSTFVCRVVPQQPGLFTFWAQFSVDGGKTWIHDQVPDGWVLVDPPQVDHMRLYTLIPSVSGSITDWCAELDKIKAMGFNTVHLLPLTVLDISQSPYSAHDLFQVEPSYLDATKERDGLTQLERFVQKAATLEMHLCFDLVLNHVGVDSNIVRKTPEWIIPDETSPDGMRRARYWSDQGWLSWHDLVLIDYEHPSRRIRNEIWAYLTEYALFWANYANQTNGFVRFDNLHSSDKGFVDHVTQALQREYPNVGIIAEYFTDVGTLRATVPPWRLNLILATPWDSRFVPQLREYLKYIHSVSEHVRFFMPITSHDSGSPAQEFGSVQSTIPRYVAAALLGSGATGITQGVEWGVKEKIQFIGKQPRAMSDGQPIFGDFLRKVNQTLVAEPALRRGENCQFVDNHHEAVIAAFRKDDRPDETGLLIACNFDILHEHALEMDLSSLLTGPGPYHCVDLLSGEEKSFASTTVCLVVGICAAHVLKFRAAKPTEVVANQGSVRTMSKADLRSSR